MLVEFNDFQNGEGFTAQATPTHGIILLTASNHLINRLFNPTTANGFSGLLPTLVINDLVSMFLNWSFALLKIE